MGTRLTPPEVSAAVRQAAGDDVYIRYQIAYRKALEAAGGAPFRTSGAYAAVGTVEGRAPYSTHPLALATDIVPIGWSRDQVANVLAAAKQQALYAYEHGLPGGPQYHLHIGAPSPYVRGGKGVSPLALRFFGSARAATNILSLLERMRTGGF